MYTFQETRAGYLAMWTRAKLLPAKHDEAIAAARKIADDAHRSAFQAVETATGVPWFLVGCLLYRESDLNLGTYLGNGQSLSRVTTVVPVGRGPWPTFAAGAIDALKLEGMIGIDQSDWTIDRMLYWCERFNGQGYFSHGNSPYIWAGTDQYSGGLFVADHKYDPNAHDNRLGVAAILKALAEIYPDIAAKLASRPAAIPSSPSPQETKPMPTTTPATVPAYDPVPQIISVLESAKTWVPRIVPNLPWWGQIAISVGIPMIENALQVYEDSKTKGGLDLFDSVLSRVETIIGQARPAIASAKTSAAVTITGAPTNGMPNS